MGPPLRKISGSALATYFLIHFPAMFLVLLTYVVTRVNFLLICTIILLVPAIPQYFTQFPVKTTQKKKAFENISGGGRGGGEKMLVTSLNREYLPLINYV